MKRDREEVVYYCVMTLCVVAFFILLLAGCEIKTSAPKPAYDMRQNVAERILSRGDDTLYILVGQFDCPLHYQRVVLTVSDKGVIIGCLNPYVTDEGRQVITLENGKQISVPVPKPPPTDDAPPDPSVKEPKYDPSAKTDQAS